MWTMFVNSLLTSNNVHEPKNLFTPDTDATRRGPDAQGPALLDPPVQRLRVEPQQGRDLTGLVKLMLQLDHHASRTLPAPADQPSAPKWLPRSTC